MQLSQQLNEWTKEKSILSKKWIEGIKKSWKSLANEAEKKRGVVNVHPKDLDWQHIVDNVEAEKRYLQTVEEYIKALRDELLIKRSFWADPISKAERKKMGKMPEEALTHEKVSSAFAEIFEIINEVKKSLEFDKQMSDPTGKSNFGGIIDYRVERIYSDPEEFKFVLNSPRERTKEATKQIDAIIGRKMFRVLNKFVKEFANWKSDGQSVDLETSEPEINHVGGMTVVFQNSPEAPEQDERKKERIGWASPRMRKILLRATKNACQMLNKKGLGKLCYGKIIARPGGEGRDREVYGTKLAAQADYMRQGDYIRTFSPFIEARSIVHELGHRYYFKFLSSEDQHNFDKWFGKVPAVRKYGSLHPWEDFATAFEAYVTGQGMTKAQRARFEQFLGRKRKLESVQPLRLSHRIMEARKIRASKLKYIHFTDTAGALGMLTKKEIWQSNWAEEAVYAVAVGGEYNANTQRHKLGRATERDVAVLFTTNEFPDVLKPWQVLWHKPAIKTTSIKIIPMSQALKMLDGSLVKGRRKRTFLTGVPQHPAEMDWQKGQMVRSDQKVTVARMESIQTRRLSHRIMEATR